LSKKKEKEQTLLEFSINFPKAPKKAKEKRALFQKLLPLIEEQKEALPVRLKSNKRKRYVILDSDEFMFAISFGERIAMRIAVVDPKKNLETVNKVGNKVINFVNTILGKRAIGSQINSSKTTIHPTKTINLAKKIMDERRIAKMNEEVKETLTPCGVYFEYKVKEREFSFATFSNEKSAELMFSSFAYKGELPFDVLRDEYNELAKPTAIIEELKKMEL
jgi:hypothetical protein